MVLGQVGPLDVLLKRTQRRVTWRERAGCGAHRAPGHAVRGTPGTGVVCLGRTHPPPCPLCPQTWAYPLGPFPDPFSAEVRMQGGEDKEGLCVSLRPRPARKALSVCGTRAPTRTHCTVSPKASASAPGTGWQSPHSPSLRRPRPPLGRLEPGRVSGVSSSPPAPPPSPAARGSPGSRKRPGAPASR